MSDFTYTQAKALISNYGRDWFDEMQDHIPLTGNQCEQLESNGIDLQEFIDSFSNQPEFLQTMGLIDSMSELQAIQQEGCASGAYMQAVTYHKALECMSECGDSVLTYIEEQLGDTPQPNKGESWAGMAVFYCSHAVELWCNQFDLTNVDWN